MWGESILHERIANPVNDNAITDETLDQAISISMDYLSRSPHFELASRTYTIQNSSVWRGHAPEASPALSRLVSVQLFCDLGTMLSMPYFVHTTNPRSWESRSISRRVATKLSLRLS
jgi:hypothetical protein